MSLQGLRFLVVSDESNTLEILDAWLRSEGGLVTVSPSRDDGLCRALDDEPDCILVQWRVAEQHDWADFTRELRARAPAAKIVVVSTTPDRYVELAVSAGADRNCFTFPVGSSLLDTLSELLRPR